jgi:hypothetical protein
MIHDIPERCLLEEDFFDKKQDFSFTGGFYREKQENYDVKIFLYPQAPRRG